MKFNWTQFGVAIGLFLLGYLTFNSPWFSSKPTESPPAAATPAATPIPAPTPAPAQK